jgi:acetyl-CoA acyltransferase
MREVVIIDGVRSANTRAHKTKGWFRNKRADEIMTAVYDGLFARNPKVKPEDVEAVFCGTAKQVGQTLDIGRLAWLAGGYPEQVAANTICQQCPSGMSALEHAARAIMVGDGDTYIVAEEIRDRLYGPESSLYQKCEEELGKIHLVRAFLKGYTKDGQL